ncbi:mucin-17 isoform X2 [Drosophila teissieri]|uniref:mucin-17 isoform X2 n=1 Tax=Drosophila teissieri TaxID=7243 RepID=UPI001CB9DD64|nr:mucin-17 isoform X2 [Drosophila teissieri]
MAKDPATTRIPRLDGVSRLPKPSTFGLASSSGSTTTNRTTTNGTTTTTTTQHIRPPTSAPKATQIFRAPGDPAKPRPASSYAPSSAALRDLGSSLKKSASGERINNAVSLLSKRTTTVLKKYFSPKSSDSANAVMSSPCDMTSSLPVTPFPVGKRAMVANDQLTSSTPMPLLRSETFVCEEEEQSNRMKLESTRLSTFGRTMDIDSPMPNETKALIRDGTRIMKGSPSADITQVVRPPQKTPLMTFCSLDTTHEMTVCSRNNATHSVNSSAMMGRTMPVVPAKDATRTIAANSTGLGNLTKVVEGVGNITKTLEAVGNITKTFKGAGDLTRTVENEASISKTFEVAANCTQTYTRGVNLTRTLNDKKEEVSRTIDKGRSTIKTIEAGQNVTTTIDIGATLTSRGANLTKSVIEPGDFTKVIHQGANLTLSMDQLPLLEHISMPSGLDILSSKCSGNIEKLERETDDTLDVTLTSLAPDKTNMKLPLNSTLNTERLLDISALQSPRHIQLLNLTQELERGTPSRLHLQSGRRSIPQHSLLCLSPQSATTTPHGMRIIGQATPQPVHLLSPLLKQAQSALVLPTRTPDGDIAMDGNGALDSTLTSTSGRGRTRYSFGLDLPDTTLDCSIELVDNSFSSSTQLQQLQQQLLKKQSSFDLDESLGILTPDQMKDFLDSPHNNLMHNMEMIRMHHPNLLQLRMEQTPSPEELPLDPIEIKSEIVKQVEASQNQVNTSQHSKLSNSFITSVTSVTSLDTGYQGDGEMSRPASRGACDHSPSNGPHLGRVSRQPSFPPPNPAPLRRQDPMTDSDFFTESDADDVLHRGDRRAQVIDGQLYGPDMMQPSASVPQMEDSCMESSGIFTDVENRCDEEMRQPELELDVDMDMSPDDSSQTMRKGQGQPTPTQLQQQQNQLAPQQRPPSSCLSSSSAATTLSQSLSNRTSYCSVDGGSARSFCGDEAFAAGRSTTTTTAAAAAAALSVQKTTSPRPHASLSSLCTVENFRGSVSSNSSIASPKSCKSSGTKTSAGKSRVLKSPKSPKSPLNRKAHTPNKWDAVMNKIASNKSLIKTNYNDVKSKVSTTRIMTPASGSSPVAGSGSVSGSGSGSVSRTVSSPRASPSVSASARRSPSATPKVPPRLLLAKRSSSSSNSSSKVNATPSPPPHATPPTRQPLDKGSVGAGSVGGGGGARAGKTPKSPTSPTTPTTPTSPPAKRLQSSLVSRGRSYSKDSHKSSHSDLSLMCNASSSRPSNSASGSGSPKLLANTQLRAAKKRDVRNLSISPTDLGPPPKTQQTTKGQSTRSKSSATPTPTSINKRLNGTLASPAALATPIKGVAATKSGTTNKLQQSAKPKSSTAIIKSPSIVGASEESLRSGVDQTELQELNNGQAASGCPTPPMARDSKRSSLGNELPCETEAKLKRCEEQQDPLVNPQDPEASVAVQEATFTTANELDAFACKETKEQCARTKGTLEETISLLQQTQRDCERLREDLHAKDVEWVQRQQEKDHLHRTELKQAEEKVLEVQMLAKQRFCELESQLRAKEEESKQAQEAYSMEVSHKLALKQDYLRTAEQKIQELQTRLQQVEAEEQGHREKLIRKENVHAARLSEANQREQDLIDRVKSLTKELNTLKTNKEHNERDLRDRLALSQDEISVLRTSSQRRSPCISLPDNASAELNRLTSEADSLRCVLELKQAEISALSKAKADLIHESEERLKLSNRVALLEAQNEMLRTELEAKTEKEKEIQQKMEELQKAYKYESIKRTRLTYDKEELQYHLKQKSMQLQSVESKLLDLSTGAHDTSLSNHSRCSLGRSGLEIAVTTSSPTSPVMKGMIERNDSVSWTLEIDDESFKGNTSKIVRRAGSLRSNNERCPIQRRQTSVSNGHSNGSATNGGSSPAHPNPLSQSMSATALLRSSCNSAESEGRPLSRARSQSMCIKASASSSAVCESSGQRKKQQDELNLADWPEDIPLCSSSPQAPGIEMRPRSSTMKLMSSEAKKFQEIQESAGEAMVSGANSEDESCSASSEDIMRSSSASSTASGGSLSKRPKQPPSRMSIEEALPCTPMEVSWSEDAADANGLA